MADYSDYVELDMTGLNVDHVRPTRSILRANYGEGYADTTRVGSVGGTRQFQLSAGVWPDSTSDAPPIGSESWMEYYTNFFDERLDNANEPFIIDWRNRKWLVDLDEPSYGVEVHTSDLFTPDGLTVNLRRVRGLTHALDGSVFDPSMIESSVYLHLIGDEYDDTSQPGTIIWTHQGDTVAYLTWPDTLNVVPTAAVQNGLGVMRFNSGATNDGEAVSSLTSSVYELFIVMKMREAAFSNTAGIFSGNAAPNNVILVGASGTTKFTDLGISGFSYTKNGVTYTQADQQAPMNAFGVVHVRVTGGIAIAAIKIGSDRDFAGRFAEADIGEVVACDALLSDRYSEAYERYLMTKWDVS